MLTNEQKKAVDELIETPFGNELTVSGIACSLGLTREYVQTYFNEKRDAKN